MARKVPNARNELNAYLESRKPLAYYPEGDTFNVPNHSGIASHIETNVYIDTKIAAALGVSYVTLLAANNAWTGQNSFTNAGDPVVIFNQLTAGGASIQMQEAGVTLWEFASVGGIPVMSMEQGFGAIGLNDLSAYVFMLGGVITHASSLNEFLGGDVAIITAGKGLRIKEGSNARMGTAQLSTGSVTVSNTSVSASTRIFVTRANKTTSTAIGSLEAGTITAGTSFVINSYNVLGAVEAGDKSLINWVLVEPA